MSAVRQSRNPWTAFARGLFAGVCALSALALAGCGGSGMSSLPGTSPPTSQNACANCGTAMISMTDAPGDFASYIVSIDSLTLTNADGQQVQTVPKTTPVDFAQLVNLSEILSAEQIPPGQYTSATLTLDYTNATIVVDTSSGAVTVPAADILNAQTGKPLTGQVTVTLSFAAGNQLVITPGTVSNLALDFNLAASNTVDLNANPITVSVSPSLTASLTPDITKQIHVRGPLVSVSTANDDYVVNISPFHDTDDGFGQLTVDTTSTTSFLVNGTTYTGSAGLTALAALPANTMTAAYGTWDQTAHTFTASIVDAGSSVTGETGDSVVGTVMARSGDTLTVSNALVFLPLASSPDWEFGFQRQMTVTIGAGTSVTEQGQSGTLPIADISVGQKARFAGNFTGSTSTTSMMSSTTSGGTLDATSGSVELLPTDGVGLFSSSSSGQMTVNLQSLGHVQASNLTFTGTGTTASQDASAAAYQVSIPTSFSTASLAAGLPVSFQGFVDPYGAAPPDFTARTVVSSGQAQAWLSVSWTSPGDATPFSILTSSEMLLSQTTLEGAATHVIHIDWTTIDPATLSTGLELVPDTRSSDFQSFAIVHTASREIDTYSTFTDFSAALMSDLGSASALRVTAEGTYGSGGVLTVDHMIVALNN